MCMRRLHGTMEHIINDLFFSSHAFEKMLFFRKDKSLNKTTNQSKGYNECCTQSYFVVIFLGIPGLPTSQVYFLESKNFFI
jgi:hypothetical protein